MKLPKQVSLSKSIAFTIALVLIASGMVYVWATAPSSTFWLAPGIYPGAPSFTVWREGNNYFAKDANGELDFSGTNSSDIINSGISESTTILLIGTFTLTAPILIHENNVTVYGHNAYLYVDDSADMFALFNVTGNRTHLHDLHLRGNREAQTQGHAVSQYLAFLCRYENLDIAYFKDDGIRIVGNGFFGNNWITKNKIVDCSGYGVFLYQTVDDFIINNDIGGHGINCIEAVTFGGMISDNYIYMSGWNGSDWTIGAAGIHLYDVSVTWVTNNRMMFNGGHGLVLDISENVTIADNFLASNDADNSDYGGIELYSSNFTIISSCWSGTAQYAYQYQNFGVRLDAGSVYNTVVGVTAIGNVDAGIINLGGATNEIHSCYNGTTWIT